MAIIRQTLDQLRSEKAMIDRAKIDETTEDEVRQHAIEDGEDPDTPREGYKLVMPHGLVDPATRPAALARLKARGYTDKQIADLERRALEA